MLRLSSPGRLFYALAVTLIGIQFIIYSDFNSSLFPLSPTFIARNLLMRMFGILVFLCGFALGLEKFIGQASIVLASLLTLVLLFVHVPGIFAHPRDTDAWIGASEMLAIATGALMFPTNYVISRLQRMPEKNWLNLSKWGLRLFGCTFAVFGFLYFLDSEYMASMIPAWIPPGNIVVYTTGLIYLVFALIFISGRRLQLGAGLITLLFIIQIASIYAPRIIAIPQNHYQWTNGFIALAMTGIGLIIGGNVPGKEMDDVINYLDVDEKHVGAS